MDLGIQTWLTENGAKAFLIERHEVPIVDISVVFAAGSAFDGDHKGVSQFTNIMLNQGTERSNVDEIALVFEEEGALFTANSDRDLAMLALRSVTKPKCLEKALAMFCEVLGTPNFPESAFLRMRALILSAIRQQEQMPEALAKNNFFSTLYGSHPYGHSILGTAHSVNNITIQDLKNFYNHFYTAQNAKINIVGNVSYKQAKQIANQIATQLAMGKSMEPVKMAQVIATKSNKVLNFPSEQTHFMMGQLGIYYHDSHYFPLLLGNAILGGAPIHSRLFKVIREEKALAYSIISAMTPLAAKGPFAIIFQTRQEEANKALRMVKQLLMDFIDKGPKKSEVQATKKQLIEGIPLQLAGNHDLAQLLLKISFYELPHQYVKDYCEQISAVTIKQIKVSFEAYFSVNHLITIIVGDMGK